MRPLWAIAAFLAGCGGPRATAHGAGEEPVAIGAFAEDDRFVPSYGTAELSRALQTERGAEATGERIVAELEATGTADQLRVAVADLAVRRRFIATLEACERDGRWCPPRLDDPAWSFDPDPDRPAPPPMTAQLRFDLASWRVLADELFGRACACRTLACVDSVGVAIDQLEPRPMPEVQGDDVASLAITRARECLFRLRGRARITARD